MFSLLLALIYLCFISLGLPDSLLGSAWPVMQNDISVPFSYAGIISMVISAGTIVSSFFSDKLVRKLGYGKMTAISVAFTAAALFGFSVSGKFYMLILWAVPYGLGAGGVDAVLNNYVALYYKAQHMSWLHCFWGVGASVSPYIMSFSLLKLSSWNMGYRIVAVIQILLSVIIFFSIPLWKTSKTEESEKTKGLSFKEILNIRGAKESFICFFFYCGMEVTASLWASSFLVQNRGISEETASAFASLFYLGITLGRAVNGFLAMRFSDKALIRAGSLIITLGIIFVAVPVSPLSLAGFVIIGLGCAPIYPCIIHMTPFVFGKENSQAMIGIQMACAYMGFLLLPPLFGVAAEHITISLLPFVLLFMLLMMIITHEMIVKKAKN